MAIVIVALVGIVALAGSLYAPRLAEETDQLAQTLPEAFADLAARVRQYSWGRRLLDGLLGGVAGADVVERATKAIGTMLHAVIGVVVVLASGIYLAAEPTPYLRGILRLTPLQHRRRVAEVLFAATHTLRWWLVGQALAMLLVGLVMGFGLMFIGVRLAFILGIIAGILEFIPFVGPILGVVPALLLALAEETRMALYVLILYGFVQTGEGYVLTPLVQRTAVKLPPVLTILSQLALTWTAGPIGLLVAVPLVACAIVATQMLYVDDALGDRIQPDFAREARAEVRRAEKGALRGLLPD